jgi:hypothetical protein
MSNQPGIAPGGEDQDEELPAAEPALETPDEEAVELDEEAAEAAADAAAAAAEEAGGAPTAAQPVAPKPLAPRVATLNPQARDGLIRCLQARIAHLDTTLAHAQEVALRDTFYSRWPNVVGELRAQALKRLEELQRS